MKEKIKVLGRVLEGFLGILLLAFSFIILISQGLGWIRFLISLLVYTLSWLLFLHSLRLGD